MMVIWERKTVNVKSLGEALYLDSGTLTPLLKRLQEKELITRERSSEDERNLVITLAPKGEQLRKKAERIPARIAKCVDLSAQDAERLREILLRLMAVL